MNARQQYLHKLLEFHFMLSLYCCAITAQCQTFIFLAFSNTPVTNGCCVDKKKRLLPLNRKSSILLWHQLNWIWVPSVTPWSITLCSAARSCRALPVSARSSAPCAQAKLIWVLLCSGPTLSPQPPCHRPTPRYTLPGYSKESGGRLSAFACSQRQGRLAQPCSQFGGTVLLFRAQV